MEIKKRTSHDNWRIKSHFTAQKVQCMKQLVNDREDHLLELRGWTIIGKEAKKQVDNYR